MTSCLAIVLLSLNLAGTKGGQQNPSGVPPLLLAKLHRGVNITRWFCYLEGSENAAAHYRDYLSDADFEAFRRMKLGFVRLCVSPEAVYRNGAADPATLQWVDKALGRLRTAHLAVLWDLHDNGQMKLEEPSNQDGSVRFWEELARHYKGRDEDNLVFELLNEPQFNNRADDWNRLQERAVEAVRKIDPKRTVLVTGNEWGGIDSMVKLKPLSEQNLIYSFHCYDPFFFTHQGATWAGDEVKEFKGVPFPVSPEGVAPLLAQVDERFRGDLKWFGEQRYGADYLMSRLKTADAWGRANRVPVLMGEFGAYPLVSPPASRARWYQAMSHAIQTLKMPFAVWGYDDAFGLARRKDERGGVTLDPMVLRELFGVGSKS